MLKGYHHLTRKQRCQIELLISRGERQADIADILEVDRSTISREIRRNSIKRQGALTPAYNYSEAHRKALRRRREASVQPCKLRPENKQFIATMLAMQWSPEQIAGWCKRNDHPAAVSHETIYKMVWKDKREGGYLHKNLRRSGRKYKKRGSPKSRHCCIPNRVDIDERPAIVELKERLGDWEVDTIVGKGHKGAIVTMVDRTSKLTKLYHVPRKTAPNVAKGMISKLLPIKAFVHTITADNGGEFAQHQLVSDELDASVYFSKPYHAWERGLNEHTNGLLRQYLPKNSTLDNVTQEQVQQIEDLLNNRPRKVLKYLTPLEAFDRLRRLSPEIALHS